MEDIVGYDKWKLDNNIDESAKKKTNNFSNEVNQKIEMLGHCPCCEEKVYENRLYVVEMNGKEEVFYHLSCFNELMREKENGK